MLKHKSARSSLILGLVTILCTYNMAYANVKVSEDTGALSENERVAKSNNVDSTNALTPDASAPKAPVSKLRASSVKHTVRAANSCACKCSPNTGKSAALPDAWWDCMKGCLRSWGVSPVQVAICAATCALGAIPLCAFCVGLDASIFMLCANGCAVYAGTFGTGDGHQPILTRKTPHNGKKATDRRLSAFAARK